MLNIGNGASAPSACASAEDKDAAFARQGAGCASPSFFVFTFFRQKGFCLSAVISHTVGQAHVLFAFHILDRHTSPSESALFAKKNGYFPSFPGIEGFLRSAGARMVREQSE